MINNQGFSSLDKAKEYINCCWGEDNIAYTEGDDHKETLVWKIDEISKAHIYIGDITEMNLDPDPKYHTIFRKGNC